MLECDLQIYRSYLLGQLNAPDALDRSEASKSLRVDRGQIVEVTGKWVVRTLTVLN